MVLEELKAKAGFGGAKLKIYIPKDRYSMDETLRGELLLFGGKASRGIKVLSISLIREWIWEMTHRASQRDQKEQTIIPTWVWQK